MSLPALAREFQHVEKTLRSERPAPLKPGVVLTFTLAQTSKSVKDAIATFEDIRSAIVRVTALMRMARTEIQPGSDLDLDPELRERDIALVTGDVIAMMNNVASALDQASLNPVVMSLRDAAPKLVNRSTEERRFIRRLASKVAEADDRFGNTRARFQAEVKLLADHLERKAREAVTHTLQHPAFEIGAFEAYPMETEPNYRTVVESISRRYTRTLARLAE